jgi:23S rRNA (cytosine1962-C5)-methyltransferase
MTEQAPRTKIVTLRKNEEHRIVRGHPWVFSNEIREIQGSPERGEIVEVHEARGRLLGIGMFNPHSLISVRMLSEKLETIDAPFFLRRIGQAAELRAKIAPAAQACRIVHGESDFLPGLIVDRYNDLLSLQAVSFGMDARLGLICEALREIFHPAAIIERDDSPLRALEGLEEREGFLHGSTATTTIEEHGLRYQVDLLKGQKTGFFLDQRENRKIAGLLSSGAEVLDCFSNDGGFALNAARGGAHTVLGLEISADAVSRARANAELNALSNCSFEQSDVFPRLRSLHQEGRSFDVIILDPPSFTRSRKNVTAARQGYRELHRAALRVLRPGGFLLAASCSHHITGEAFLETIERAVHAEGRKIRLLDWRGAAPDHPTLPEVPETQYLKFGVFHVA